MVSGRAKLNIPSMVVHSASPHWTIDSRRSGPSWPTVNLVSSPAAEMV